MIIIPDIHGRTFWKEAIKDRESEKIIFLGDYLDPYPDESPFEEIQDIRKKAIENFQEILEFKKEHPENVILLLGNHDLGYMVSTKICNCRMDHIHYMDIRNLFRDNKNLFQLCYEDNNVIYSHGGIRKEWVDTFAPDIDEKTLVDYINDKFESIMNAPFPVETYFAEDLGCCSFYRGGWDDYSSCVWGDVHEWIERNPRPYEHYQVFAHTRLKGRPLVTKDWACLDCSQAFIMTEDNKITDLDGEEIKIITLEGEEE